MQKRLFGTNVDQEVEVMLSPSKMAAQRIYATKRNSISFHAALQSGSPESAMATFEKPVQDTVPVMSQKQTFPTLAVKEPSAETMESLYQCPALAPQYLQTPAQIYYPPPLQCRKRDAQAEDLQKLVQDNEQQFKIVQQQIGLLRKVMENSSSSPTPVIVQVPATPAAAPVGAPVVTAVPTVLQQQVSSPTMPTIVPTQDNSWFSVLSKLIFAAIFLVGLLRIVEWLVEKITNFIVPERVIIERPSRSPSRSSSFSASK